MSDEEDREELRRALAGDLSRRRLVELERLASGLGALLREVHPYRGLSTDLIARSPISVGGALHLRKLLRTTPILLPSLTVRTVRLLRPYSASDVAKETLASGFQRRIDEERISLPSGSVRRLRDGS